MNVRLERSQSHLGIALDMPATSKTPAAILNIKISNDGLWYVDDGDFRYKHLMEMGFVQAEHGRMRGFQIVFFIFKVALVWRVHLFTRNS